MKQNTAAQIVHESEAQRQHVRIAIPAYVWINDKKYEVKDLSSGGIAIQGADKVMKGQILPMRLELPFGGFTFSCDLTAEVQYFDARQHVAGCRFTNLKSDQISLLNYIFKSFLAGHAITSDNVINIVSRNNFVSPRKSSTSPVDNNIVDIRRQLPGIAAVALLGAFILFFIGSNIYNYFFVEKSMDGIIAAPVTELRASRNGIFINTLPEGTAVVRIGEAIGQIRGTDMNQNGQVAPFVSPCDCYVAALYPQDGQYLERGARLVSLVPNDARPWMIASVTSKQAARLKIGGDVKLNVAGINAEYTGKIKEIESGMKDSTPVLDALAPSRPVKVKIQLDQKLPVDFVNRPAQASFSLH